METEVKTYKEQYVYKTLEVLRNWVYSKLKVLTKVNINNRSGEKKTTTLFTVDDKEVIKTLIISNKIIDKEEDLKSFLHGELGTFPADNGNKNGIPQEQKKIVLDSLNFNDLYTELLFANSRYSNSGTLSVVAGTVIHIRESKFSVFVLMDFETLINIVHQRNLQIPFYYEKEAFKTKIKDELNVLTKQRDSLWGEIFEATHTTGDYSVKYTRSRVSLKMTIGFTTDLATIQSGDTKETINDFMTNHGLVDTPFDRVINLIESQGEGFEVIGTDHHNSNLDDITILFNTPYGKLIVKITL